MAEALGHNVPLVFMGIFGVGAMLAGLAALWLVLSIPPAPPWPGYRSDRLRGGGCRRTRIAGRCDGRFSPDRTRNLLCCGIDRSLADVFALFGARQWAEHVADC